MKDKSVYVATALECIDLIKEYTSGHTLDTFLEDRKTQDAVIRNLEVIGQTLKDYGIDMLNAKSPIYLGRRLQACEIFWSTSIWAST